MAGTNAYGAQFGVDYVNDKDGSPGAFTPVTIAKVISIDDNTLEREIKTNTGSHDDDTQSVSAGAILPGQLTLELQFNPEDATHQNIETNLAAGTVFGAQVELALVGAGTTGAIYAWNGFYVSVSKVIPYDDIYSCTVVIQTTSALDFTAQV